jgi:hypothetical protein
VAPKLTAPPTGKHHGGIRVWASTHKPQAAAGFVMLLAAVFYLRARGSSSTSTATAAGVDPNAIDPSTGLTYGAEETAASAGQASGSTDSSGGSTTSDAIDQSTAVAAALEGLTSGLGSLATQLANDQVTEQDQGTALAQLSTAVNNVTSQPNAAAAASAATLAPAAAAAPAPAAIIAPKPAPVASVPPRATIAPTTVKTTTPTPPVPKVEIKQQANTPPTSNIHYAGVQM